MLVLLTNFFFLAKRTSINLDVYFDLYYLMDGQFYYGKTQIANSLKEFLEKYQKNENYFD